jgi:two-component sensor histidine kinase
MSINVAAARDWADGEPGAQADHRIANHLAILTALVRMKADQVRKIDRPVSGAEAALMLKAFEGRLAAVARLHRMLADGPASDPVDAIEYVRSVVASTVSCLAGQEAFEIRYQFLAPCLLPAKKAICLGLVIGELVANAVKYAHPSGVAGVIEVKSSSQDGASIQFEVADDGVGLPDGFDALETAGFGLRMVRNLAMQLDATIAFENYGLGLNCLLRFPCRDQ